MGIDKECNNGQTEKTALHQRYISDPHSYRMSHALNEYHLLYFGPTQRLWFQYVSVVTDSDTKTDTINCSYYNKKWRKINKSHPIEYWQCQSNYVSCNPL